MLIKPFRTTFLPAMIVIVAVLFFCTAPQVHAATLLMSPYKIILNASPTSAENLQDIQAIVGMGLPAGFAGGYASLTFSYAEEDLVTVDTTVLSYCYIDSNLLISFDRADIQAKFAEHSALLEALGANVSPVLMNVDITGYVDIDSNNDGVVDETRNFSAESDVEIFAPGKK